MLLSLSLDVTAQIAPGRGICLLAIDPDQALTALSRLEPVAHVGRLADEVGRMEGMFGIEFRGEIGAVGVAEPADEDPGAE